MPEERFPVRDRIPECGLKIGNNSPVWFKKRRVVWCVLKDGQLVRGPKGQPRYFGSSWTAAKAMETRAKEIPS